MTHFLLFSNHHLYNGLRKDIIDKDTTSKTFQLPPGNSMRWRLVSLKV
ncbi:MAG: hypothetical protein JXR65_07620 [Bacteroidales bacterium]|nr:hypothetical protein [Bacteroidales bacterium]